MGGHQREVHVLLERRVERRVSRLVGVVRNLHPLGVEAPEARPFDGPGVLGDQRPSFLLRKGEGDVGVWKEREIILSDAFSRRVGVFAAQTSHEAPAAELRRGDGVGRRDVLRVVDREALVVVARPCVALEVSVERVVVHVVVGVFGSGLERPAGRKPLFEGQRRRGDVVDALGVVAVGRIRRRSRSRHAAEVVVSGVGFAARVVGKEFERRAERVDLADVVERRRVVVADVEFVEMAVRACHRAGVPEIRVGVVRLPVPVAPVLELRADAVPAVDLDHRAGAGPEAAVAAFHRRMCVQLLVRGLVARLLAGGRLVLSERSPCRGVEVHAARMQVDVGRRIVPVYDLSLRRVERHRAVDAVLAAFFERDADDASRRVGVVVGARGGHDLYFLNLLGPERPQVGQQLFRLHAQFAVVDVDLRAALAVD